MIPLCEPNLTGKEKEYTKEAISSGWVSGGGPFVEKFEEMVAAASQRRWCVATLTGTAAIHLALVACGLKRGMQVTMPSMAFIGSANAVVYASGVVRFCDVFDDWTYDRTVLGGVIDAAPAIGVRQEGLVLCYSFNGNKTITTGQGGAVVGNEPGLHDLVRHLATTAKIGAYEHDAAGFNYGMPNLNAAMGCAQMERLEEFIAKKREIAKQYGLQPSGSCWMSIVQSERRKAMIAHLRDNGIDARPFWKPLHMQAPYMKCERDRLPYTGDLWDKLVCLPCSTTLTNDQQSQVLKACAEFSPL